MKKKSIILGLSLGLIFATNPISEASQGGRNENKQLESINEESREYIFHVIDLDENIVKVRYEGEYRGEAVVMDLEDNKILSVDKDKFPEDVAIKDQFTIKSRLSLKDLDEKAINKADINLIRKYEKPVNMDKVPDNAKAMDFEITEIYSDDPIRKSATLAEIGNPNNLYSISFDNLRDDNPTVGDQYKVYWDGISLQSYPAQFGKIYRVEKLDKAKNKEVSKVEFEVIKKSAEAVTLAETENKDNLYNISFKDLKDNNPEIGDRYMITWSGMSTKSYPAQFIDINDVEKWVKKGGKQSEINKEELKKAIAEADKTTTMNGSFTKESVKAFEDAKTMAKEVDKNDKTSQEEVDAATKKLNDAITGLTFVIDKNMEMSKIYEVIEIKGEEKQVILKEKDSELTYMLNIKELNDKDVKVGDRYKIKTNGIILPSNPAQFSKVLDVAKIEYNKTIDKSDLNKTIMDADKILFGDASYKEETVDNFHKANEQAKKVYENKEASQKEVDEANINLKDAIKNLAEKDGVIKKKFVLKEIIKKGVKVARLQSVDYPDKEFSVSLDTLNDENPKINDHYMVTIEMVDPEAEPFEMREITKIEKINEETKSMTPDYSKLFTEVEKAEIAFDKNKKYTKESLEAYTKALENAKMLIAKNSNDNQETIDKATRDLKEATNNLKVVEETEIKNEEKKAGNKLGFGNPKTGIAQVDPLVVVIGGAAALLKKKFN